jgi:tRNA threonylcarbamoyladenosine biosynthesis protein TsaE
VTRTRPLASLPVLDALTFRADSALQMRSLGRLLGSLLRVGDVIGLEGPLGAGKTTLTQGVAQGLAVPAERHVASPSFALVNEHPGRVPLVHADFYRLRNAAELAELGLDEIFERAVTVIEWVELFPEAVPPDHLHIAIAPTEPDGARLLTVAARGPRSTELLHALAE